MELVYHELCLEAAPTKTVFLLFVSVFRVCREDNLISRTGKRIMEQVL